MTTFTVKGDPIPQPRPRVYARGGVGRDPRVLRAKQLVVMAARRAKVPKLTGPVAIWLRFYRATARNADWENLAKLPCDALNGIAWVDDGQIVWSLVTKHVDRGNPRTEIRIEQADNLVMPTVEFINAWEDAWQGHGATRQTEEDPTAGRAYLDGAAP